MNNYGRRLLKLCKSTGILIAYGRCGKDIYIGKHTCKDISLLDYLLLSQHSFSDIKCFEVHDFDPILVDVHSCLTADVSIKDPTDNELYGRNDKSVVWHLSLPLMNSFNKTEAAVFSFRPCFLGSTLSV